MLKWFKILTYGTNILDRLFGKTKKNESSKGANTNMKAKQKTVGDNSPSIITQGPNSPVTVNYPNNETKEQQTSENILDMTPKGIIDDLRNTPPYQRQDKAKYYIGSKVKWKLYLSHVEISEGDTAQFAMSTFNTTDNVKPDNAYYTSITCEIEVSNYPQLKRAKEGTEVLVSGEIADVDILHISLSNVSL